MNKPLPGRGTIVIADDDENLRELLKALFQRYGFAIHACADGEELLRTVQEIEDVVAIVTDLLLPFVDGFDLIRQLRESEQTAHTPIIVLSDLTDENDIVEAFSWQVNEVISKPFQPQELIARVLRWIGQRPLPPLQEIF
ncbi:response regulator [Aliidiomarina sp. Khilg15.8]